MKKQLTKQELIRELEAIDNLNNKANNEQTKRIEQLEYCTDKLINKLLEINEKYTKLQIKLQEYDNFEVYEVHTLYEDGTTKFRNDFQTMIDAIKYYNSLDNISKELVINTNDEEFNTIYGYYAENNTGINKIDIIKLGGLKND